VKREEDRAVTETVQEALHRQINLELSSSYSYLAMSAYCASQNFPGCARWLRIQSQEEYGHAMRLLDFLLDRNAKVDLRAIAKPGAKFGSVAAVFEASLKQELEVSKQIDALYELAFKEKAFAAMTQLQWFLTEQVEEEKTAREIVAKFKMVGNDAPSLLELDRELGARTAGATAGGAAAGE
jgi:ferritin